MKYVVKESCSIDTHSKFTRQNTLINYQHKNKYMKQLKFSIQINAPKKKVWDTMLQPETYKKWVNVSWPGSYNEGKWATGEKMKFISSGQGGTLASLEEVKP